jgi:arylsulfatase A-like enzyme
MRRAIQCGAGRVVAALAAVAGLVAGCGPPARPIGAVLLLTVDTLRADRLGAYGSERGLTPHLDALAARSVVFERAYAPAPFTFPSLAGLFTGRYPVELGIRRNSSAIPEGVPTLASALKAHGWRTGAVVSNVVLRHKTGLVDGFDLYDDTLPQQEAVRRWPERRARATTDAALAAAAQLSAGGAPWLLWVHYQDPHGPYTPPEGWRERYLAAERSADQGRRQLPEDDGQYGRGSIPHYQMLGDEREVAFYRAGYDAEVAYADAEIGRLLAGLEARGLLRDALVLFAADHGEALGEHDYWFAHGHQLTDELVHVPLLLSAPGLAPGRRAEVVCLVDVFPTLHALLLDAPPADVSGRDLLAPGAADTPSVPYMETLTGSPEPRLGVVEDGFKLILTWSDERWLATLYRLGHEDIDLAAPAPQVTQRLRARLDALRQRYDRGVPERRQQLSPEEVDQLRALGYVEDDP